MICVPEGDLLKGGEYVLLTHVSQGLAEKGGELPGKAHSGSLQKMSRHRLEEGHMQWVWVEVLNLALVLYVG